MGPPALRALLLTVLVAGAAYGAAPGTLSTGDSRVSATDAAVSTDRLTVVGDPGGVDAHRAYRRLQVLYERDFPALTARFRESGGVRLRGTHPDRFFGLFADPAIRIERPVRGAGGDERVSVSYRPGTRPAVVERVLVHEFAHALEPPMLREEMVEAAGDYAGTTDATLAREATTEGAAVYVADAYVERNLDVLTQSARLALTWPTMTDATRLLWAPYRYGADHVRARVASPAHLALVYENPPLTTERVLHPFGTETERRPLAVRSRGPIAGFDRAATDAKGELYLRVLLASELSPERAGRAAAGWGADRLVTYASEGNASFAWVLRWDTARDASEFESAMAAYLNATATRRDGGWTDGDAAFRLDCVSEETCYVLAGDPSFVRSARVTGNASDVVVSSANRDGPVTPPSPSFGPSGRAAGPGG